MTIARMSTMHRSFVLTLIGRCVRGQLRPRHLLVAFLPALLAVAACGDDERESALPSDLMVLCRGGRVQFPLTFIVDSARGSYDASIGARSSAVVTMTEVRDGFPGECTFSLGEARSTGAPPATLPPDTAYSARVRGYNVSISLRLFVRDTAQAKDYEAYVYLPYDGGDGSWIYSLVEDGVQTGGGGGRALREAPTVRNGISAP